MTELYNSLKSVWKELGIKGQVKNFSSLELWVLSNDSKPAQARILPPGFKTPPQNDVDAFKRVDQGPIENHNNWWKFYDFSTVEISNDKSGLKIAVIAKTAVDENHFKNVVYKKENWGEPLKFITNIERNDKNNVIKYQISDGLWLDFDQTLRMVCYHEIDNARPVFPKNKKPYIRTKRDVIIANNFSSELKNKV